MTTRIIHLRVGGDEYAIVAAPLPALLERLTTAERDVVFLALLGHSNAEIAHERGTTLRTVANQLARAYRKLGVRSRSDLVTKLG
jgi:DNA-binding CsgD family transcriptional regulator